MFVYQRGINIFRIELPFWILLRAWIFRYTCRGQHDWSPNRPTSIQLQMPLQNIYIHKIGKIWKNHLPPWLCQITHGATIRETIDRTDAQVPGRSLEAGS